MLSYSRWYESHPDARVLSPMGAVVTGFVCSLSEKFLYIKHIFTPHICMHVSLLKTQIAMYFDHDSIPNFKKAVTVYFGD